MYHVNFEKFKAVNIAFVVISFCVPCLVKDQLIWAQDRIVGGDEIEIEKVPYMVRIYSLLD